MDKKRTRSRAFLSAYRKGRMAFQDGENATCPYPDKRGGLYDNVVTFSRAFQRFWEEGWNDAQAGLPEQYELYQVER